MKALLSLARRAIDEYDMIDEGERVAVLVSGGKDSLAALYAMHRLSKFHPKHFSVVALTLSMGFEGVDYSPIQKVCDEMGIEYHVKHSDLGKILFDIRKEKNPCSLCAKMRRGMLNDLALEYGCKKVALGHHFDDAVETFLLSLTYEGRIYCFSPKTYLSRTDITQIRPLIYVRESEIIEFAKKENLPIVKNPCPANGFTKRQDMKELLVDLKKYNPKIKEYIIGALKRAHVSGW